MYFKLKSMLSDCFGEKMELIDISPNGVQPDPPAVGFLTYQIGKN